MVSSFLEAVAWAQKMCSSPIPLFFWALNVSSIRCLDHVHLFMHEGKEGARGPDDRDLQDIAVARVALARLASFCKTLPALFLHTAIGDEDIPAVQKPGPVEEAALEQLPEHEHRQARHRLRVHAAGMMGRIIRASDSRLARKAGPTAAML